MLKPYYLETGWNKLLQLENLTNVEEYINTLDNLQYTGHGGTCIAFVSDNLRYKNKIIKVCIKNDKMLKNSKIFLEYAKFLQDNDIKIMPPCEILYEDDYFIVYTQEKCIPVSICNNITVIKILNIIKELITKKIKITDLFYKNFGIYNNDIYIYDYHDYDFFYSSDKYYVCHIAHLMNLYYNNELFKNVTLDVDTLFSLNFGKDILPEKAVLLLKSLYNLDFEYSIKYIDEITTEIKNTIACEYNEYQYINIDDNCVINLSRHTKEKFDIVSKLIKTNNMNHFTIIDYGCCLGGIGSKIAQLYPESKVFLNNITVSELNICEEIKNKLLLSNVTINNNNVTEDKNSYDVCLYFAVLHHILRSKKFDDVINMVLLQTKKYTIIELPFGDDVLLKNVKMAATIDYSNTYYYLENIDIFKKEISKFFNIIDISKIDYNTNELNRYAFTLEKII